MSSTDLREWPTISFLGHAGFDLRHAGVRLIVDPWFVGTAFDNGWELLFPAPLFDPDGITHLWLSHEHPDHFSPPTLRLIPPDSRAAITVIVQRTEDRRVAQFMLDQGYGSVLEVHDGVPVSLTNASGDVAGSLSTLSCAFGDSCHLLDLGGIRILNTNDCSFEGQTGFTAALKQLGATSERIDLLITQFSYANWVGNPDEVTVRQAFAEHKLDLLWEQVKVANPRHVFPCASYIVFGHEENIYLNDCINDLGAVCEGARERGSVPIVLRNGSSFPLSPAGFTAMNALVPEVSVEVRNEIARVLSGSRKAMSSPIIDPQELLDVAKDGLSRLRRGLTRTDFFLMQTRVPVAVFELRDHPGSSLIVKKLVDAEVVSTTSVAPQLLVSSAALRYAVAHDFGFETLLVNGRFEKRTPEGDIIIRKLSHYFACLRRKESFIRATFERRVAARVVGIARRMQHSSSAIQARRRAGSGTR